MGHAQGEAPQLAPCLSAAKAIGMPGVCGTSDAADNIAAVVGKLLEGSTDMLAA
jgi:hypothetical protein